MTWQLKARSMSNLQFYRFVFMFLLCWAVNALHMHLTWRLYICWSVTDWLSKPDSLFCTCYPQHWLPGSGSNLFTCLCYSIEIDTSIRHVHHVYLTIFTLRNVMSMTTTLSISAVTVMAMTCPHFHVTRTYTCTRQMFPFPSLCKQTVLVAGSNLRLNQLYCNNFGIL
jgi:hypothetical protein